MSFNNKRVLLTGATGGIGREMALQLASQGARLALVCFDAKRLSALAGELNKLGTETVEIVADFSHAHAAQGVADIARQRLGGVDILINNAGLLDFTLFEQQSAERIAQMIQVNVTTPIQLTRALLPDFLLRNNGHIVNVGSIFGSLGFPHYVTYSASKFAMRGFSQALRRELVDSDICVTYVAPRAVKTALNDVNAEQMMQAGKIAMDAPEHAAAQIIESIAKKRQEHYIGQPESFFAWLNSFLPGLVNQGLKQQTRIARKYATRELAQEKQA